MSRMNFSPKMQILVLFLIFAISRSFGQGQGYNSQDEVDRRKMCNEGPKPFVPRGTKPETADVKAPEYETFESTPKETPQPENTPPSQKPTEKEPLEDLQAMPNSQTPAAPPTQQLEYPDPPPNPENPPESEQSTPSSGYPTSQNPRNAPRRQAIGYPDSENPAQPYSQQLEYPDPPPNSENPPESEQSTPSSGYPTAQNPRNAPKPDPRNRQAPRYPDSENSAQPNSQNQEPLGYSNPDQTSQNREPKAFNPTPPDSPDTGKPNNPYAQNRRSPTEPPADLEQSPENNPSNRNIGDSPIADTNALETLLADLNQKLKDLEKTQSQLNRHISDLESKVKDLSKLIPEVKTSATSSLLNGNPDEAVNQWNTLKDNVESPEQLQNVTNDIVSAACEQNAPPQSIMNFVHQLPVPQVKPQAYNTLADKMGESEPLQEQMYWREMSPYLTNAQDDVGRRSPTMQKMNGLQQQMRLIAAQPVRRCARSIAQRNFNPALATWAEMTVDIRDRPDWLRANMQKIVSKSYDNNPANAPLVLEFITSLPPSQEVYRQLAFNHLQQQMQYN